MKLKTTSIDGLAVLEPVVYRDHRGCFLELFKSPRFEELGLPTRFAQDNVSVSRRGVARGLHFQIPPFEQGKLVTCLSGAIFDVAVDLRPDSATFGKWESVELSEDNHTMLYIPPGLAHGFQALRNDTCVLYKCTKLYSKQHERGVHCHDPEIAIPWPLPNAVLPSKDSELPSLEEWRSAGSRPAADDRQ